ncbi:Uncharacterised protein [Mycobacterium tuberculosis]|nr:Uncharacterised protein [Mycobacterium tuberculosis]
MSRYLVIGKIRLAGAVPFRPPPRYRWRDVETEWVGRRGEILELGILNANPNAATAAACRELETRYRVPARVTADGAALLP